MSHSDQPLQYPFNPGDLVSTERRFRNKKDYELAVKAYGEDQYNPSEHSYSVEIEDYKELLLRYQPSRNYPADCGDIKFTYSPEPNIVLFKDACNHRIKYQGYKEIEFPGNGFRGKNDRFDTYRAILLPPGKQGKQLTGSDYEGFIINPPYPRRNFKLIETSLSSAHKYVLGVVGVAVGIALAINLLSRERSQ